MKFKTGDRTVVEVRGLEMHKTCIVAVRAIRHLYIFFTGTLNSKAS